MSDTELLIAVLCISPLVSWFLCIFWGALKQQRREGTDRYDYRPGSKPFRPESKIKPFRKSSDMLTKIDDE
jgi:hypothetical protein